MQPTSTQTVETDRELKAYIYQQLVELQPYLIPDSQMAVSVHQVAGLVEDAEEPADLASEDDFEVEIMEVDADDEDIMETSRQPEAGDYIVKLVTTLEGGKLVAEGHGTDVYEAFGAAKIGMMNQLAQLQNSLMDSAEREEEIQSYLNGSRVLH